MGKDLKGKELGKGISQRADGRYIARFTSKTGKRKTLYDFKLNELKRNDIVNIGLHFFLKDVRPMLPPVMNHSIAVA